MNPPRFEDLSMRWRFIIVMGIALGILFAVALYGWLTGAWQDQSKFSLASKEQTTLLSFADSVALAQGQPIDVYADIPPDTHLLALDKQALEQAYLARIIRLFDVWLSSTQGQDATNFQNGLRIARLGYTRASQALAKRAAEIERTRPAAPAPQEQRK